MKLPRFRMTLERKKAVTGLMFVSPVIIGFLLFFLYPLMQSIAFSVSNLHITQSGFELEFVGLKNYEHALFVNPNFRRVFVETTLKTLADIPAIIIFSFFAANLLNEKFRGRGLARVIFFLPVIVASGAVMQVTLFGDLYGGGDIISQAFSQAEGSPGMLGGPAFESFLLSLKMPQGFAQYILNVVNHIPEVIEASGIPILIFLAGLQSVPPSLYEAAHVEGATAWESFWKITFPLLTPLFLTNVVYIIVDSFTNLRNPMVTFIKEAAWGVDGYGVSVAMAWIYFAMVGAIILITIGIISRRVVYMS